MALDLGKVGKRERLKVQREPHWQRLRAGCFLGFRPSKRGGKGTWIARVYDEDTNKYQVKSLGDFGMLPGNEMFAAGKKEAEKLVESVAKSAPRSRPLPMPAANVQKTARRRSSASNATSMRMPSPR